MFNKTANAYQKNGCTACREVVNSHSDAKVECVNGSTTTVSKCAQGYKLAKNKMSCDDRACLQADTDANKKIDVEDLLNILSHFETKCAKRNQDVWERCTTIDADGDKIISVEDLLIILAKYGIKC